MNIVIAGGTGLIGSKIVEHFSKDKHHIYILTRNSTNKNNTDTITYVNWLNDGDEPEKKLENIDVVINLAGESINSRWTNEQKKRILTSRLDATKNCLTLMEKLTQKPKVYLNASAVGFYGTSLSTTFTEDDHDVGTDFLATVVEAWEREAIEAEALGIRTVLLRFGVVLASDGGALSKMMMPYKLFAGGTVGSGKQWLSWIHIDDVVSMVEFAVNNEKVSGALNVTGPNPKQMKQFGSVLGGVLGRPHWLPAPSFALKILLGEMSLLVLEGQKVLPKKAIDHGFQFTYPHLEDAFRSLRL